jgi:hypothetical protein
MGTHWAWVRHLFTASFVAWLAWGCGDDGDGEDTGALDGGAGGEAGGYEAGGGNAGGGGAAGDASAGGSSDCGAGQELCSGECVELASDPKHCGSCREKCDSGELCSNGRCREGCTASLTECDDECVDTDLDVRHCGDCGSACDDGEVCSDGECGTGCAQGLVECATRSGASRCVNPLRDRWNCGDCGVACGPGYLCSAGVCALSCQVELVECDGLCVDPLKDRDYCGAATGCATGNESAGQICEEGSVCSAGSCGLTCAEGLIQCGDSCVDPARDLAFCGASGDCSGSTTGAACGSGERCAEGACELACPTGQLVCAGRCVDRLKDREYCGATLGCGEESVGSDGTSCGDGDVCSNGTCAPSCQDGLIECDGQCVDPLRDRAHCGVDAECQPNPNAAPICAPGYVCNGGECSLSCPSWGVKCGSECVDPTKDIEHCGATAGCGENGVGSDGTECASGHVCSFGICMPSCQDGLVECNGTCIVPERDREFCGATPGCGVDGGDDGETCPPGYVCNGGDCSLSCPDNLVNCAGVCTDPQVDRDHCGATAGCGFGEGSAGDSCAPGHVCNAGQCSLLCSGTLVNCAGVCVDPHTDRSHCGATPGCGSQGQGSAGLSCQSGYVCNDGACSLSCPAGLVRCGTTCVDPNQDRNHCGATLGCGAGSGSAGAVCGAGLVCNQGTCDVSCPSELVRCGDVCVDPDQDRSHCGATPGCGTSGGSSGVACQSGYVCNQGACSLSCSDSLVNCSGQCIDPAFDRLRCGATAGCGSQGGSVGHACEPGYVCASGSCSLSCPVGLVNCAGVCIDPRIDRNYCGATGCGMGQDEGSVCVDGQVCSSGECAANCADNLVACGGTCVDPFTSRDFCGATEGCGESGGSAGTDCALGSVCRNGACVPSCLAGYVLCGGVCVDPKIDRDFCGATEGCGEGGGSAGDGCAEGEVCNLGECALSCQSGLVECDDTCIDPDSSRIHCGATEGCGESGGDIGEACPSGYVCSGGECALSCAANLVNCGGVCVDPDSDPTHCGASGNCGTAGVGTSGNECLAGEICDGGTCTLSCQSELLACAGTCVDPTSNPGYCGASGDCQDANAGTVCTGNEACVGGQCATLASLLDPDCRVVNGVIWCMYDIDPETGIGETNRTCTETCEQAAMAVVADNAAFIAQNTQGECEDIYGAFAGDASAVFVLEHPYCVAYDTGDGSFGCSVDAECQEYSVATATPGATYVCACREVEP